MSVPESTVEAVVREVSERMSDPSYGQLAVGTFVAAQPQVARFLSAAGAKLGADVVVHAAFHAEVMRECLERHLGAPPRTASFRDLDDAAGDDAAGRFGKKEPALASYLALNVDEEVLCGLFAHVGLTLSR